MPQQTQQLRELPGRRRARPTWTFFRQWLKNPLGIAALSPSSRWLAREMIAQLPAGARRVVELGGGTGVFTEALLDHGIAARDLLVVELNDELHRLLKRRFPEAHVVRGDARALEDLVRESGYAEAGPADAMLSGLGLLSMSRATQRDILRAAFAVLAPEGRLIQFTYGPASPVSREVLDDLGLTARRVGVAWRNVPPAAVYVLARSRSRPVKAVRTPSR
ncbi:MAG: methyltransferase domain-containing protein [Xanthomonadales bacterium]|nr:methyltransferase domain-containing protein [Xanthomonadales bacterium]